MRINTYIFHLFGSLLTLIESADNGISLLKCPWGLLLWPAASYRPMTLLVGTMLYSLWFMMFSSVLSLRNKPLKGQFTHQTYGLNHYQMVPWWSFYSLDFLPNTRVGPVFFKLVSYISIFGSIVSKIMQIDPKIMTIDPKMMTITLKWWLLTRIWWVCGSTIIVQYGLTVENKLTKEIEIFCSYF